MFYNTFMPKLRNSVFVLLFALYACQPQVATYIYILDGDSQYAVSARQLPARQILEEAGVVIGEFDSILLNGNPIPRELPIQGASITLQVRRAIPLTIQTPNGSQNILSAAATVGEALAEAGFPLYRADYVDPPVNSPLDGPMIIVYIPSREMRVYFGDSPLLVRSARGSMGRILAEAGIPLIGLDTSLPVENDSPPSDGQMRVVRVHEKLVLSQRNIPFETEYVVSNEIEIDQNEILQPGLEGVAVSKTRIRFEDGKQVSRQTDDEVVVRAPRKQVTGYGTKVVTHQLDIGGSSIQYWRAVPMFATSYSPCRSGVSSCLSGTSLGLPVKKGVVAVKYDWYLQLAGQRVYIPGYGVATIADVGGGYPDGRPWIDLGYSDSDWEEWGDWVTVYFLEPAPDSIPYILK
jgi:uncharacterized protein YabE (DUF348 family)